MKSTISWIIIGVLILGGLVGAYFIGKGAAPAPIVQELQFSILVEPAGNYTISMLPVNDDGEAEISVKKNYSGSFTISNVATTDYTMNIQYDVFGLPEGSYSFSVNPVAPNQDTILTIDTSNATIVGNTTYVCTLTATSI